MFAVVEHQQPVRSFERGHHTVIDGPAGLVLDAKCLGDSLEHMCRLSEGREFDKPHPVRKTRCDSLRKLERQPRLYQCRLRRWWRLESRDPRRIAAEKNERYGATK